jgi:L-seryl-tRNA(Ser) seleniumtransferase
MVGRREAVAAARRHPLARALRIDKLSLAALEATLRLYRDPDHALREIPVLAMLNADSAVLTARAERMAAGIGERARVVTVAGKVGGGALPLLELEGSAVALDVPDPDALASTLRTGDPPVIARVNEGRVLLDPRTLSEDEPEIVIGAVRHGLGG